MTMAVSNQGIILVHTGDKYQQSLILLPHSNVVMMPPLPQTLIIMEYQLSRLRAV